jgi:hypothetical protein
MDELLRYAIENRLDLVIIAMFFIYGNYKGWLVWGRDFLECKSQRDTYKNALDTIATANAEKLKKLEEERFASKKEAS